MGSTTVILGGGVGGLVCAAELRRRLPRQHRVVLVEKNAEHAFAPSFLWLMTGARKPQEITRPVAKLLPSGIRLVQAEVQGIDLAGKRVRAGEEDIGYDYLVIALGAELAPETIPGLAETAHTFYTFEGAARLRDALPEFKEGTVAIVVASMPYKCPGAPHEGAMLIADLLRRRGLGKGVDIHLFTPEPQPMPVAGPELGGALKQMLEERGIAFHPSHMLAAVDPGRRELSFKDAEAVKYDLLVAIPPHRGPALVREAGLTNDAGWIPVDRGTLETGTENVYAIGDVTAVSIPGRWKPDVPLMLPKAGVFAHGQAKIVAARIAAEVAGASPVDQFAGDGYCVLEAGAGVAGFAFGDFYGEPSPQVHMRQPGRAWHLGKVAFEQWWLTPFGPKRTVLELGLAAGSRALGVPPS